MTAGPTPYARWRAIREHAFAVHVAAQDEHERLRAIEGLTQGMRELRRALDETDVPVFDAMHRRDYETLLLAEATVDGVPCEARLRRVAEREVAAGRLAVGHPFAGSAGSAVRPTR